MGLFNWAKRLSPGRQASADAARSLQPDAHREHQAGAASAGHGIDPGKRGVALLAAGDLHAARDAFAEAVRLNPGSAANHVNLAYALQQTGAEAEALPHLQRAVAIDPASFDAHYMLAGALERAPDLPRAAAHLRNALALQPDFEPVHADLCRVLTLSGDTAAARAAIVAAIASKPDNADFHHYLGNLCMAEADPSAAIESYARALELRPDYAQVHSNLGLALHAQKRFDEAVESFERAIAIAPLASEAHAKLGLTRKAQGRLGEATAAIERALELQPDDPETLNSLGSVFQEQGQLDRAIANYRRAIALRPELPGGYANLGWALDEQGDLVQAVAVYRQGLAIEPLGTIHNNLGIALQKQNVVDEAIDHYQKALELQPENLDALCNLASAFADAGEPQQAIATYRRVLDLRPEHLIAHSNLLFNLAVYGNGPPEDYLAEARRFDLKLAAKALEPREEEYPVAERRLRIGFVTGDFRNHPVGLFIEGVLHHLHASKVELFAYPTTAKEDELTARIKPLFSRWHLLKGQHDEVAARAIRSDQIDILLDLAGHSGDHRLPIFRYRPAPVQVSWLGYFASTGMSEMDYVLADEVCVPLGNEHQFTEKVWRLPQTRLCFTPPPDDSTPGVSTLPALQQGHITFGCFQRLSKINDAVLALWGQVFLALPTARLLLQSPQTGRPRYVEQILSRLAVVGISADRVTVRGPVQRNAYLASYAEVDIVLDTFPFTGGTTTCEALWMGVPTLTLSGETMIARQGLAMMSAAGFADWVAEDPAMYVRKAVAFSADVASLARLRASLRARVRQTPLFDVRLFAQRLEDALVGMWQEHVAQHRAVSDASEQKTPTQSVASQASGTN